MRNPSFAEANALMSANDGMDQVALRDFPLRLKLARVARALTQRQLADVLGVEAQTVWNWENSKALPTGRARERLRDEFGDALFPAFTGTSERRDTFPQHPFMRAGLLDVLAVLSRAGATRAQVESARRLLSSAEAIDLYSQYGAGSAEEMTKAMGLLAGGIKEVVVSKELARSSKGKRSPS